MGEDETKAEEVEAVAAGGGEAACLGGGAAKEAHQERP